MATESISVGRHRRGYYLYLIPGFVGLFLIVIGPQIANFVLSFTAWKGVGTPRWVGLQNYQRLLTDDQFWGSMRSIDPSLKRQLADCLKLGATDKALLGYLEMGFTSYALGLSGYYEDFATSLRLDWDELSAQLAP